MEQLELNDYQKVGLEVQKLDTDDFLASDQIIRHKKILLKK